MQLHTIFRIALIAPLICWGSTSAAFQINTCLRDLTYTGGVLGQAAHGDRFNLCPAAPRRYQYGAVHEHITSFSVSKYRKVQHWSVDPKGPGVVFKYLVEPRWSNGSDRTHLTKDIIFGTWWNDDPLMLMWGQGLDLVNGMRSMEKFFKLETRYPGSLKNLTIEKGRSLGWHSHFGRLQHLHFMTDLPTSVEFRQQRLKSTTDKALQWMQFAFKVASQSEGFMPSDPLDAVAAEKLGVPSVALNFGVNEANVKVRTLFARSGVAGRDARTADVALGSMLHIIQDSFSPAHSCRVPGTIEGEPAAVLRDVYNYDGQDDKTHKELDGFPDWLKHYAKTGEHQYANDPIAVGAWLIEAVDRRLAWDQVEAHLRATIFMAVEPSEEGEAIACIGGRP